MQLTTAQSDIEAIKSEKQKLIDEREEQEKAMQQILENAQQEKVDLELKWKKEFELLRNNNSEREEQLLEDCEWQVRNMQKACKEKIDKVEKEKAEAIERANDMETEAREKFEEVKYFSSVIYTDKFYEIKILLR